MKKLHELYNTAAIIGFSIGVCTILLCACLILLTNVTRSPLVLLIMGGVLSPAGAILDYIFCRKESLSIIFCQREVLSMMFAGTLVYSFIGFLTYLVIGIIRKK